MLAELDVNGDGCVSFEEWKRGGQANVPLIVLLGFDEVLVLLSCFSLITYSDSLFLNLPIFFHSIPFCVTVAPPNYLSILLTILIINHLFSLSLAILLRFPLIKTNIRF